MTSTPAMQTESGAPRVQFDRVVQRRAPLCPPGVEFASFYEACSKRNEPPESACMHGIVPSPGREKREGDEGRPCGCTDKTLASHHPPAPGSNAAAEAIGGSGIAPLTMQPATKEPTLLSRWQCNHQLTYAPPWSSLPTFSLPPSEQARLIENRGSETRWLSDGVKSVSLRHHKNHQCAI